MIRNLKDYWEDVEKRTDDPLFKDRRISYNLGYATGQLAVTGNRDLTNPYPPNRASHWGWEKAIKEG